MRGKRTHGTAGGEAAGRSLLEDSTLLCTGWEVVWEETLSCDGDCEEGEEEGEKG